MNRATSARKQGGYQRPQGGNTFKQYAGAGYGAHPLEVDYKKLAVGGRVRVRFLDCTAESCQVIDCREVKIFNKQKGSMMNIKLQEPKDPDDETGVTPDPRCADLVDHDGTAFLACKPVKLFRMPVFHYWTKDDKGNVTEVNELRYLEFTQGLRDSMAELETFQNGTGAFNEETGRPDYDVDLIIIDGEGTIPKNYAFDVVFIDPKTKKTDVNFGVEAEEVLAEDMAGIDELWDDVQNAMATLMSYDDVEKKLAPPRGESSRPAGVSARPGLNRSRDAADTAEEPPFEEGQAGTGRQAPDRSLPETRTRRYSR